MIEKVEDKKIEIQKIKAAIPAYKAKLVSLLKSLAQRDYLSDPSSIFDIPQNESLQQLINQFRTGRNMLCRCE